MEKIMCIIAVYSLFWLIDIFTSVDESVPAPLKVRSRVRPTKDSVNWRN